MRILGWNCQGIGRGLGNPKMCHLAKMITSTRAHVIFLSKTKNSKFTHADISTCFNMNDTIVVPSLKKAGGLWLMWNDDLQIFVYSSSFYVILDLATDKSTNTKFGLVRIYGDPYHHQSNAIWEQVANFVYDNRNLPILCIGDMNEIMYDSDKSTTNINRTRMYAFRSIVKNCGLFDLGFCGPAYTWTNKIFSDQPLYQCLYRCLVNREWCVNFQISNVYNMPLLHCFSDHAPILMSMNGKENKPVNTFKFGNWWLKENDFQDYAKASWKRSITKPFAHRTKMLASYLKVWCRKKKPLHDVIKEIEQEIGKLQAQPLHTQNHAKDQQLSTRYEQAITRLNDFYVQRAKKNWVKDGDRNTSFFHRAIAKRRRRNTILSIKDEHDVTHFMLEKIANIFVTYFRSIFSSSVQNPTNMQASQQPSEEDPTYSIPEKIEILEVLKDMKRNASPRPDGFNVEFYIAT
uniref:Uncharacterized protein n=1 Tax=Avena sativa TaxID=4498 RepID=A0ACD5VRH3_AVESA